MADIPFSDKKLAFLDAENLKNIYQVKNKNDLYYSKC